MQSEPPNAEPPKRKRRWFQYSLRTLLLLTMALGIGSRWITVRAQRQKAAVDAILNDGGAVVYDYQIDAAGGVIPDAKPPGPDWLRKWSRSPS